ncbi:MAG: hypothetical protein LAT62_13420 [Natronospirillum sp.]|uniref:hypothetical protein n=1 Tax=Natronospirillum sp. TaxID=2812955 RepID=UPI0025FFA6C3|nr:hypothetical protein [Natronospirillum sp.]MCH8552933.1 hypothetical protein [Natronospirillum sp.]
MFTFNRRTFVRNQREAAQVANTGGTVFGFYRKRKNGALLMDMDREPRAFFCTREDTGAEVCFVVTASQTPQGARFSFGMTESTRQWLGMPDHRYDFRSHKVESSICEQARASLEAVDSVGA